MTKIIKCDIITERKRKEMNNTLMASRKNKRSEASKAIAQAIIEQYQPTNAEEMQDALKDIFGPMFEAILQGEMDSHLGYDAHDHGYKDTTNRRNGYSHNSVKTTYGDVEVAVPPSPERVTDATFTTLSASSSVMSATSFVEHAARERAAAIKANIFLFFIYNIYFLFYYQIFFL